MPGRPHKFFWNSTTQRWEVRAKEGLAFSVGEGGIVSNLTASLANANITTATITDLGIGSTLTVEDILAGGVATIANLNVGTLLETRVLKVNGGTPIQTIISFVGSSALITAVGTLAHTVATLAIVGANLAITDSIFGIPRGALGPRISVGPFRLPAPNVLVVDIANLDPDSAGSFPAISWNITQFRSL